MTADPPSPPWFTPAAIAWCQLLLDSYRRWVGRDLIAREGTPVEQAVACFQAPIVIVSHGMEPDPVLNYGNRLALTLWEMDWAELTRTPSRCTVEPVARGERADMLARAARDGYLAGYRGVRISRSGRRFLVENATVWTVVDREGIQRGQGATFAAWTPLAPGGDPTDAGV